MQKDKKNKPFFFQPTTVSCGSNISIQIVASSCHHQPEQLPRPMNRGGSKAWWNLESNLVPFVWLQPWWACTIAHCSWWAHCCWWGAIVEAILGVVEIGDRAWMPVLFECPSSNYCWAASGSCLKQRFYDGTNHFFLGSITRRGYILYQDQRF